MAGMRLRRRKDDYDIASFAANLSRLATGADEPETRTTEHGRDEEHNDSTLDLRDGEAASSARTR